MPLIDDLGRWIVRRRRRRVAVTYRGYLKKPGALWRTPDGQEVDAAYAAGLRWAMLGLDHPPEAWGIVRARLERLGVPYGWWFHCRNEDDLEMLVRVTLETGAPFVGINVEEELRTTLKPDLLARKTTGLLAEKVLITLGWVGNDVDLRPTRTWATLLEVMPQDSVDLWPPSVKVYDCLTHARSLGALYPMQLMGCYPMSPTQGAKIAARYGIESPAGWARPEWFDRKIPNHVYTANDVNLRWAEWAWREWGRP